MTAVGIVGLGLMGGSLARDLSARGDTVLAVETDAARVRAALDAGVIAAGGPEPERLGEADVVVVATPPGVARTILHRLPRLVPRARWITDLCGTKRGVVAAAEAAGLGPRFVGSHPLAGGTGTGFDAARPGLFRSARVQLCPTAASTAEARAGVEALWTGLGARTEWTTAAEHDAGIAWSSQLPQLAASSLGLALARSGVPRGALGPGGRDTTRLAASAPALWAELTAENADHLLAVLDGFSGALAEIRDAVEAAAADADAAGGAGRDDGATLRRLLEEAREWSAAG